MWYLSVQSCVVWSMKSTIVFLEEVLMRFGRIVILSLCFCVAAATMAMGVITDSKHDFSSESWNDTGEICVVCHAPHGGAPLADAPLWSHSLTVQSFTLYSSGTLDAGDLGQPVGTTRLCLSCHDGTIALDSFGGDTGSNTIEDVVAPGGNLNTEHPISFTYDAALATSDGGLYNPTTTSSGLGGTISDDMLFGGKMECSSCHDVHNAAGAADDLLVKDNAGSNLCLTCHNK
jgi:predicted CXXCH cytochrome family protein